MLGMATTPNNSKRAGEFLTPTELADRWRWHPESIRRLLRQKRLPSLRLGGKRIIPLADVLAYEVEHLVGHSRQVRQLEEVRNA